MGHKHMVKIFSKAHKVFRIMITSKRRNEYTMEFKSHNVYL